MSTTKRLWKCWFSTGRNFCKYKQLPIPECTEMLWTTEFFLSESWRGVQRARGVCIESCTLFGREDSIANTRCTTVRRLCVKTKGINVTVNETFSHLWLLINRVNGWEKAVVRIANTGRWHLFSDELSWLWCCDSGSSPSDRCWWYLWSLSGCNTIHVHYVLCLWSSNNCHSRTITIAFSKQTYQELFPQTDSLRIINKKGLFRC